MARSSFEVSQDEFTVRVSAHASSRLRQRLHWRRAQQRQHAAELARYCAYHHRHAAVGDKLLVELDDVLWAVACYEPLHVVVTTAMPAHWRQGIYAMEEWLSASA